VGLPEITKAVSGTLIAALEPSAPDISSRAGAVSGSCPHEHQGRCHAALHERRAFRHHQGPLSTRRRGDRELGVSQVRTGPASTAAPKPEASPVPPRVVLRSICNSASRSPDQEGASLTLRQSVKRAGFECEAIERTCIQLEGGSYLPWIYRRVVVLQRHVERHVAEPVVPGGESKS
jgi:hypothetical protein